MDENPLEILQQVAHQRDLWRAIAIAYIARCEKDLHEKVFQILSEEQKTMAKKEIVQILDGMKKSDL